MSKQLNISLAFTADTTQAKNSIQSLVNDLNKISSSTSIGKKLPITKEMIEAQNAAKQLGEILSSSLNVNSGKLDLTKFTQQLNASGMSLSEYGNKLSALGVQGDQAFLKLAQSIAKTQAPLMQSSGLLNGFMTTLKNTAKWQISSSILHGFIGAIQSAYGYAQDLNESLNNIRIVTGQNTEQMAKFAEQANRAAKNLSTTTTAYTDAALIFYQQGLKGDAVTDRADVVIKMANASGQSAEIVSDQLTAIWNNFYDGSESLESYADKITALGAATASSSEEISTGLEKFASVAETVGLSYEYATAALATVTATTRQSADVVGTAFKTLFARLNDLKLGETLDDGTTLGQYTENLAKVGVNIKDVSGQLKDMDVILEETAAKWKELDKDQQVALAKGVAGIRQYNQFIALMSNWDFMKENLKVVEESNGALQDQADTYAESWAASSKRVKASLETIYSSLIDDDFFINFNDTFSGVLNTIKSIIDSIGGLKGVLSLVGVIFLKFFGQDLTQGINNGLANFRVFTGIAKTEMQNLKKEAYDAAMAMTKGFKDSPGIQSLRSSLENTYILQNQLTESVRRMSPEQKAVAEEALKTAQHYNDIAIEAGMAAEKAEELYFNVLKSNQALRERSMNNLQQNYDNSVGQSGSELLSSARNVKSNASNLGVNTNNLDNAIKNYSNVLHNDTITEDSAEFQKAAANLRQALDEVAKKAEESSQSFKSYESSLKDSASQVVNSQKDFNRLKSELTTSGKSGSEFASGLEDAIKAAKDAGGNVEILENKLKKYKTLLNSGATGTKEFKNAEADLRAELSITNISTEEATQKIANMANMTEDGKNKVKVLTDSQLEEANAAREAALANSNAGEAIRVAGEKTSQAVAKIKHTSLAYQSMGSAITGTLGALSSFAMGLNSIKSLYDTFNNTELSTFEKTTQIMMSLGIGIPMLIAGLTGLGKAFHFVFSAQQKGLTGQIAYLLGVKQEINTNKVLVISKTGEVLARGAAGDAAVIEAMKVEGATTVTKLDTAATWANITAKMAKYWYIGVIIAAIGILIGITYSLIKAYNAEAEAAERAAEQAEQVKKAYEETKQAAEDLKSTIDKYKDAKDSMSGLKQGTLEYKEALLEANEQALQLLNTYEGLAKYASRTDEGLIIISEAGLDEILNQQYEKLNQQQQASMMADLRASEKKEISDILNFARSQNISYESMQEILTSIQSYFNQHDITELIPNDIKKLSNLTEEQRNAIATNIDGYSKMANSLLKTNSAQEILTEAYLDAAWRLNNPDVQPDEAGRLPDEAIVANSLFTTYENQYDLDPTLQQEARDKVLNDRLARQIDTLGYAAAFGQWVPGQVTSNDAAYYADLMGYDMNDWYKGEDGKYYSTDGGGWPGAGSGFLGLFPEWEFHRGGQKEVSYSSDELIEMITKKETEIANNIKANEEAPVILGSINDVLAQINESNNLTNLLYSGQINKQGQGEFAMSKYQMSQAEALEWLNRWSEITTAFNSDDKNTGFWQNQGFDNSDSYLNTLKEWLTNRSEINDAEAFNASGMKTADLKTTSDNVFAKVSSGSLTSANADDDTSYQNMVIYANDLLRVYPELTEAANTFTDAGLIGTQEWIAAYDIIAGKINMLDAMAKSSEKLQGLKDKTGKDYTKFYEGLSSEEQILFAQLDINKYQSEQAIKAELARLQGVADENEIKTTLTSIESAQSLLSDGDMTEEDWKEMRDNTIKWGQDGIIAFNEFTKLTYEQQIEYLEKLNIKTHDLLVENVENTIATLESLLKTITDEAEREAIQSIINILKDNVLIYNEISSNGLEATNSLIELQIKYNKALKDGTANLKDYIDNLIRLSEQYDNTSLERKNLQFAYNNLEEEPIAPSNSKLKSLKTLEEIYETQATDHVFDYIAVTQGWGDTLEELVGAAMFETADKELDKVRDQIAIEQEIYDNALADYNQKLEEYKSKMEEIKNLQQDLEASTYAGEASEKYDLNAAEIEVQADQIQELYKAYNISKMGAVRLAVENQRMNKGVSDLVKNWKNWSKELHKTDKTTVDYAKAAVATTKAVANLVGASEDLELPKEFFESEENLKLIEEAAQGSTKAIELLGIAVAKVSVQNMSLLSDINEQVYQMDGQEFSFSMTTDEFESAKTRVLEGINQLYQQVADGSIKAGDSVAVLGDTWIEDFNKMAIATGMSVEDMNSKLSELGLETEVKVATVTMPRSVPKYKTTTEITARDNDSQMPTEYTTTTSQIGVDTVEETFEVAQIGTEGSTELPDVKYVGNIGNNISPSSIDTDTSSSSPKSGSKKKRSDVVDRYKEIDDVIDKHQRTVKQLETEEAGLYGKDKINSIYSKIDAMKLENEALEQKIEDTKEFLKLDEYNLQSAIGNAGLQFEISEDGRITNYTETMNALYDKYSDIYDSYTGGEEDVELTEDQDKEIKKWEKIIEDVEEYYSQYEDTRKLLRDQEQKDREEDLKHQEEYFENLNNQLENSLEIETEQLDYIERKLALIADDCFELAEGLGLMLGSFNEDESWDNEGSQYGYLKSQKADLEAWRTDLETAYKNGDINYNQYMEGMKTLRDMALSNAEAVKEFDTAMMEYYENSINKITEKFSRLSDLQEHNIGMLDHMQSVVELLGKSADPRNLTAIVNAQKDVAKNNLEESEAWFDVMKEQAEFKKNEYDKKYAELAADGMTEEDWQILEGFEKEWLAAQKAANEAEDQMYSDFETWLEKTKEATKNAVDVANKQWEKSLLASMFGEKNPYASFEDVTLALDRQKSLQEDILDVTNKKYETDKLIRKVQQDIDKSTNSVAKKELKAFTERIKAKQDQTTLSETELGILEKEYELLQAKIALEEAQNAKSTVRLQRDSEGNFGYVYTADQDKVANAEQAYLDADNALYNARLEAADDYGEKYIQAQQELYNTITEIDQAWQDGEYASYDEYLAARKAAFDHYEKLIVQYQGIYNNIFADNASWITDFTTDESRRLTGNVIDDVEGLKENIYNESRLMSSHIINSTGMMSSAWEKNMKNMDGKTEGWRTSTDKYLTDVSGYFTDLQGDIKTEIETSGGHFTAFKDLITPTNKTSKDSIDSLATATGSVVTQSGNLTTMLTKEGGLIDALEEEITFVGNVTTKYQAHRTEVQGLSGDYQKLAEDVNNALLAEQNKKNWNESQSNESDNSKNTDTSKDNGNGSNSSSSNGTKWFGNATWERGVEVYELIHTYGALGNGIQNRIAEGAKRGYNQDEVLLGQSIIDNVYPIDKNGQGMAWEDAKKRLGFDTGGYTGEWDGGYGKLAFLHSKELVLNQGDTANFLASMELLDSIVKTIDLYSANAQWGGILSTPTFGSYGSEPIQQNITIEAHFPDATDRNEIEEAFKSLGNLASQYITKY